jgi:ribosomal protein S18 acetylase RimI-like enzyme
MEQDWHRNQINACLIMNHAYLVKPVKTAPEIQQCWEVAYLLRPHLDKNNWLPTILEMMKNEKYCIAGIMDDDKIVAFAGYRNMTSLHSGDIIYIDDLCTLESYRGRGLASQLLSYVNTIAKSNNKDAVVLDTNFNNNTAQKLYLKNGFQLTALHLSCNLRKQH